ncbi:hypothetical protein [Saccharothrix algeriensis]|uniref:Regulatory protein n=1 Tax=Saccharothrix algeriensis TaxID=173560 RepID=A0ABS2SG32_9PSEU|nr:hypothetical protein [Saccharothrix algeriensis]MBM7814574.1 hypothetical protein [Saccharothrix algeriensis]
MSGGDKVMLVLHDDALSLGDVAVWLRGCLDGWPRADVVLVGVVVGELYDNARLHGAPPYVIELVLDRAHDVVTASVGNRVSRVTSAWRRRSGLLLVEALSEQWGALVRDGTTTTWAEILLDQD